MTFIAFSPNLALDRTLYLNQDLQVGHLQRVHKVREVAGGKAVNIARVLKTLGAEVTVAGFLGGFNGQKFRELLSQEQLQGIFQEVSGETRECHIVLDQQAHPTEIYERGPVVSLREWRALLEKIPKGPLFVSGSLANGISAKQFAGLLKTLPSKAIVDSSGTALEAALKTGCALVKPNKSELSALIPIKDDGIAEAKLLYEQYGVAILLSLGSQGACYIAEETHRVEAPKIKALNPVASGDSLLAAFVWAKTQQWSNYDALRLAVAAGTENAATGGGARFSKEDLMIRFESLN